MNEVDVIKGAREILAAGRWRKGSLMDNDGNHCILGALNKREKYWSEECLEARRMLTEHIPPGYKWSKFIHPLALYNDDPATTLKDMLDLIDKTLADMGAL